MTLFLFPSRNSDLLFMCNVNVPADNAFHLRESRYLQNRETSGRRGRASASPGVQGTPCRAGGAVRTGTLATSNCARSPEEREGQGPPPRITGAFVTVSNTPHIL